MNNFVYSVSCRKNEKLKRLFTSKCEGKTLSSHIIKVNESLNEWTQYFYRIWGESIHPIAEHKNAYSVFCLQRFEKVRQLQNVCSDCVNASKHQFSPINSYFVSAAPKRGDFLFLFLPKSNFHLKEISFTAKRFDVCLF